MFPRLVRIIIYIFLCIGFTINVYGQDHPIKEALTNSFIKSKIKSANIGTKSFAPVIYKDSLIRTIDKIEEFFPVVADTASYRFYHAIFGNDTLSYKERRKELTYTYGNKHLLEVESDIAPYQRFEVEIDGLSDDEIESLKREMRQMKTNDILLNNSQTCIFYALNLLFDSEGINPEPIITRNTTFTDGHQLNTFFDYFLKERSVYPCTSKAIKKSELPEKCILVFRNAYKEFIHAVFYRNDEDMFYSKNGLFAPETSKEIFPYTSQYGRQESKRKDLDKVSLDKLADTVIVYTVQ